MNELDEVLKEFLIESHENLDQLDRDLVALEKAPRDRERLASIFRTIHTIKGTCGFFDLTRLGKLTHAGENLLCRLRDGQLVLTPDIASALLALVDVVRTILRNLETTGQEGDGDYTELTARLTRLQACGDQPSPPLAGPTITEASDALTPTVAESAIRVDVGLLDRLMNLVGELV
ncbi:MAG TPA: Hpt domain-containing protein, partial [Gemmataceae bacterium]|nr:Hpt domain-containing protein [Gemmataceae bacterium]